MIAALVVLLAAPTYAGCHVIPADDAEPTMAFAVVDSTPEEVPAVAYQRAVDLPLLPTNWKLTTPREIPATSREKGHGKLAFGLTDVWAITATPRLFVPPGSGLDDLANWDTGFELGALARF